MQHPEAPMVSLNLPTSPSAPLAHRDRPRRNISDGVRPPGRAHESPRQCILVALDWVREKDPSTSLGLGSIAAAVRGVAPTKELYFNVATGEIKPELVAENILQSAGAWKMRIECLRCEGCLKHCLILGAIERRS